MMSQGQKETLAQALGQVLPPSCVYTDVPMSKHTTFKVGGPVDFFVEPTSPEQVAAVVRAVRQAEVPLWIIGCGSNLLVADAGLSGVAVHLGKRFSEIRLNERSGVVTAQAGATNEDVSAVACACGLAGYEFASGIPGTIGGATIMNAGAYDGEFKDVATSVTCLTSEGEIVEVPASDAEWSYRHSMMMDKGWIVLAATMQLRIDVPEAIQARIDDLSQRRASKQPLDVASAGSTFKRPEGHFAGPLIQQAGMQGYQVGDAMVSDKHAGFVVNVGSATAADVVQVIRDVQEAVMRDSGVELEPEVRMWGF